MMSAVTGVWVLCYIYRATSGVAVPTVDDDVLARTAGGGARRAVACCCSIPLRTEPTRVDRDKRGRGDPAAYRTRTAPRAAPGTGRRTSVVAQSTRAVPEQPHSHAFGLFRSRFASPPLSPPLYGTAVVGGVSTKLIAVTRQLTSCPFPFMSMSRVAPRRARAPHQI